MSRIMSSGTSKSCDIHPRSFRSHVLQLWIIFPITGIRCRPLLLPLLLPAAVSNCWQQLFLCFSFAFRWLFIPFGIGRQRAGRLHSWLPPFWRIVVISDSLTAVVVVVAAVVPPLLLFTGRWWCCNSHYT